MSDHEWCRDVRRDEAVRAAEDAAAVPAIQHRDLPEQVALLWASIGDLIGRVVRLEGEMDAGADLTAERDAALRERDAHKDEYYALRSTTTERELAFDALRARVAELEAAAAVRPMGWIARHEQSPPVGKYVMCRWDVSARPGYAREVGYGVAKRGPDGMWRAPSGVEKIAPMHWMPLLPGVEGGDAWEAPLASAPAANAGGVSNPEPISGAGKSNRQGNLDGSQEPVAWGVIWDHGGVVDTGNVHPDKQSVDDLVAVSGFDGTVVPLYAAPQPPRGWLTEEEREAVEEAMVDYASNVGDHDCERIERVLRALLARETPPRVKVPSRHVIITTVDARERIDRQWIAAIRAAGGEVEG